MKKHRERVSLVALSLDGEDSATHDAIRNHSHLAVLMELAQEWGAYGINLAGVIPVDWAEELVLSDEESLESITRRSNFAGTLAPISAC